MQRQYHSRFGEIDLIAQKDSVLALVEVKTRKKKTLWDAKLSVTVSKQRRIIRTAMVYLQKYPTDCQPRFDVAECYYGEGHWKLRYWRNAFDLSAMEGIDALL